MTVRAGHWDASPVTVATVCALALLGSAPVAGQIDAGLLATVRDREITVTYDASANQTEMSLGIVPSGVDGSAPAIALAFLARFPGRTPSPGKATLAVRAHVTARSDPRARDPRTGADGRELVFRIDPQSKDGITLYLYATSWGYPGFVAPGDEITVAFFALTPAELRALDAAGAISGRALGSEFTLAPEQLDALGELARRLAL